jgi:hypothetical protein
MKKSPLLLLLLTFLAFQPLWAQPGNALNLDGSNDQVVCPLPAVFNSISTNNFTMEAWVYPTGAVFSRIIYAQLSTTNFATLSTGGTNNIYFYVVSNGTNYSIATSAILPSNTWTHVAARWTASTQSLAVYFNGALQAGAGGGSSSTGTSGLMTIGTRPGGAQYFPGSVDEVRIWSSARSQCEIQSNMNRTFTAPQTNLVAYYPCDQGIAGGNNTGITTLNDASGNTNNGTLTNFGLTAATSNFITSTANITSAGNAVGGYTVYQSAYVCYNGSYTFPNAGPTAINITAPVSYASTLTAINGCDSVVNTTAYPYPNYESFDTALVCLGGSVTYPDSTTDVNVTSQMTHTSTLQSVTGCDSLVYTLVDVLPSYNIADAAAVCSGSSYTYPDGSTDSNITAQVMHQSIFQTVTGCDSIVETTVSVHPTYSWVNADSVCMGGDYTFADGVTVTNIVAPTVHNSLFQTVNGCDSLLTTTVTVIVVDTSVTVSGGTLTSNAVAATYQWYDCNTGLPVAPPNAVSVTPFATGNYAVRISQNGCMDSSACYFVLVIGVENGLANGIKAYPNPSNGSFVLQLPADRTLPQPVEVVDALGRVVWRASLGAGLHTLSLAEVPTGVYTVQVHDQVQMQQLRIVIVR